MALLTASTRPNRRWVTRAIHDQKKHVNINSCRFEQHDICMSISTYFSHQFFLGRLEPLATALPLAISTANSLCLYRHVECQCGSSGVLGWVDEDSNTRAALSKLIASEWWQVLQPLEIIMAFRIPFPMCTFRSEGKKRKGKKATRPEARWYYIHSFSIYSYCSLQLFKNQLKSLTWSNREGCI